MKAYATPSTTVKRLSPKSSCVTMALSFDDGLPCRAFRLKRRSKVFVPISKLATDMTTDYIQFNQASGESGINDFRFSFRTPRTMKSQVIPPEIKLPSFHDDDEMPRTNTKQRKRKLEYSSVRVDLNKAFEAVAID